MAGTSVITSREIIKDTFNTVEKITVTMVGDSSDGTVPNLTIPMFGTLVKVVTNPGATAPSDNYDLALGDPDDSALDVLGTALANRATATTQQVYPLVNTRPVLLVGSHTLSVANTSVNSAIIVIFFYLSKNL